MRSNMFAIRIHVNGASNHPNVQRQGTLPRSGDEPTKGGMQMVRGSGKKRRRDKRKAEKKRKKKKNEGKPIFAFLKGGLERYPHAG